MMTPDNCILKSCLSTLVVNGIVTHRTVGHKLYIPVTYD